MLILPFGGAIAVVAAWASPSFRAPWLAREMQEEAQVIGERVRSVMGAKNGTGYASLTTSMIARSKGLPAKWVQPRGGSGGIEWELLNPNGSTIELAPTLDLKSGTANGAWTLAVTGISNSECFLLATNGIGLDTFGLAINGIGAPTEAQPLNTNPMPNKADAEEACVRRYNAMTFYVR